MANPPPAPAPNEQSKVPSPPQALDTLQAMLNMVLVNSGRYIKAHQAGPDAGRAQFTLKRTVTAASERFQNALDELENDIYQAQVVLRRDLALLKADRRKREAAVKEKEAEKEAEKARLAAASSAKKNLPVKPEEPPAPTPAKLEPPTTTEPAKPASPPALNRETEDFSLAVAPTSASQEEPPAENTNTAQDSEFDFDAIFGDPTMDASADASNSQGDLHLHTSGPDLNFTLDDSGPSLLRGLEDFAKSSDDGNAGPTEHNANLDLDFAMHDLPDITANTSSEQPSTTKPADTSTAPALEEPANDDSNFDTMATDSLDDLFNLDYENPEDTQFDDAFFGFDEN